jgi:rhodanese-related sulfurtransferase
MTRFSICHLIPQYYFLDVFLASLNYVQSSPSASNDHEFDVTSELKEVFGPYCGIYSVHCCLRAIGLDSEPQDLVRPEYVSSIAGSTVPDLLRAIKESGAHGVSLSHLTVRNIERANNPMLLSVRGTGKNAAYNHWIAFLGKGEQFGTAVIYDSRYGLIEMPISDIMSIWNGSAIEVSSSKDSLARSLFWTRLETIMLFALLSVVFVSLPFSDFAERSILRGGLKILFFSLCVGVFLDIFSGSGMLWNSTAVAEVFSSRSSSLFPEIDLAEMQGEDIVIIDARLQADYVRGSIRGAINLPVFSSIANKSKVLKGIKRSSRIVVYCQSSKCSYSDDIANFLHFNGFSDVRIFRGGYAEWVLRNGEEAKKHE